MVRQEAEVPEAVEPTLTTGGVAETEGEIQTEEATTKLPPTPTPTPAPHPTTPTKMVGSTQGPGIRTYPHPRAARSTGEEGPRRPSVTVPWTAHGKTELYQDKTPTKTLLIETRTSSTTPNITL